MATDYPLHVNEYLRKKLAEIVDSGRMKQIEIAKAIGVEKSRVSQLYRHGGGFGTAMMKGIAKILDTTPDALEREAEEWWKREGHATQTTRTALERYPNRAAAAEFARRSGIDPKAIALVESMSLKSSSDPSPREWLSLMESEASRMRLGLPSGEPLTEAQRASTEPPRSSWRDKKKKE